MSGHLDSAEWGPILYKDITTSTMDDARQALTEGGGHGTVCAAGTQESGRGRVEGRRWLDDGSALLFTVILEKNRVTAVYPPTQLMALCLCRYLEKAHRLTAEIKWPNDVLVSGGKIAGILVEASGGFYLGGMGVNISQREFTQPLRRPAVSLASALEGREERSGVAKSAPEGGPAEPGSPTASAGGRGP
ncbi:MAG: biotin--[acetyl-CoA-carboxylase] ligase, partial [Spirochaetales bacterium]